MAQWFALKAEHPDALLFLRMGDFYELFFADAEAGASALDIALTARGEHAGRPIPMCGVPVHAAEAYLARLIRRGFRVAVAEQMEDPKTRTGKAPIRRAVVRLVTPGTLTEDGLLDAARPNLLLALTAERAELGAAWLDISTGLFETAALPAGEFPALLARLDPAEILAPQGLALGEWESRRGPEAPAPSATAARERLAEAFGAASLDAFGSFTDPEARAAAAALDYVRSTAAGGLPHLARPEPRGAEGVLALDPATRASLELLRARDGGTPHSLFAAIDRTLTAPGARLLGAWIAAPLTAPGAIAARQDMWSWMGANPDATARVRPALRAAPDMARALGRLSMQRGGPRDLAALRAGL
ncbi:MAG: DNA mismatch repair protein MutS, partial [Acetobacteraceae bacterium]